MANPWDLIEPSILGDVDENATYAGVGRVMSAWGAVEVTLSYLYAILAGRPRDGTAIREYGKGRIFRDRVTALVEVADTYFCRKPQQDVEGQFNQLIASLSGFSNRRNEVAHGMVRPLIRFSGKRPVVIFCLLPPYYDFRHHSEKGAAEYRYTSETLNALAHSLVILEDRIDAFSDPMEPPGGW